MFLYRAELKGTGKLQYVIEPCRAAGSMCELTVVSTDKVTTTVCFIVFTYKT